jgi:hypothetical protein
LGCGWDFGYLGILERDDLPLAIFLYDDQRWASFYFAPFVAFLELHVCSGEYDGDIGPQKANAPQREGGMAASVDRLEDVPVRRLYGSPPVQLSPKDLDEVGILGKHSGKADAVVTIPRGFDLLQDSFDDLLICCHDRPPE